MNGIIDFLRFVAPQVPSSDSYKAIFSFDEANAKSFFFCRCMVPYSDRNQRCNTCGPLKNFFYIPDLPSQFKPILDRHVSDANSLIEVDLTIYTDGVNPFRNSDYCFWPIFFTINQIPYKHRFLLENIIIVGIFFGKFKPTIDTLIDLSLRKHLAGFNDGFNLNGKVYKLNLKFLVADKPAKAETLCMTSHNSTHFCHACLKTSVRRQVNNNWHTFVPFVRDEVIRMRNKAGFLAMGHDASSTGRVNVGIKGTSFLLNFSHFDPVKGTLFDWMHGLCLGLFKNFFKLVFFETSTPPEISLRRSIHEIDSELKNIKFNSSISNSPQPLSKFSLWKAKDFRNFFLFVLPLTRFKNNQPLYQCYLQLRNGVILLLNQKGKF